MTFPPPDGSVAPLSLTPHLPPSHFRPHYSAAMHVVIRVLWGAALPSIVGKQTWVSTPTQSLIPLTNLIGIFTNLPKTPARPMQVIFSRGGGGGGGGGSGGGMARELTADTIALPPLSPLTSHRIHIASLSTGLADDRQEVQPVAGAQHGCERAPGAHPRVPGMGPLH